MSNQYRSVFADDNILRQYNCTKVRSDIVGSSPDSLVLDNGWSFTTLHKVIPNDEENRLFLRNIKIRLLDTYSSVRSDVGSDIEEYLASDQLVVNSYKLKMIPMIFPNDVLRISNTKSGKSIELGSEDALFCWISQVCHGYFKAHE